MESQKYRMEEIYIIQGMIEKEINYYKLCLKKLKKISNIFNGIDIGMTTISTTFVLITTCLTASGVGILFVPASLITTTATGGISLLFKLLSKKFSKKNKKNDKICQVAEEFHRQLQQAISESLRNENIDENEFKNILIIQENFIKRMNEIKNSSKVQLRILDKEFQEESYKKIIEPEKLLNRKSAII